MGQLSSANSSVSPSSQQQRRPGGLWNEAGVGRGLRGIGRLAPDVAGQIALSLLAAPRRRPLTTDDHVLRMAATRTTVLHGSLRLRAYVWDPEGASPSTATKTVLLVHGWSAHASGSTGALVEPLTAAGFRVVAFDAPGHGRSPGKRTDLADFGQAVRAAMRQLGPVHAIIAHSFGAAATMWMLAHQPDEHLEKLVLFGPPSDFAYMVSVFAGRLDLTQEVVQGMGRAFMRRYGWPPDALSIRCVAPSVRVAGLIVHDRQDNIVAHAQGNALAEAWPGATLLTTDGLGHSNTLRDPEVQRRVLAFLGE